MIASAGKLSRNHTMMVPKSTAVALGAPPVGAGVLSEGTGVPAYLGGAGWLGVDLDPDPAAVDWVEVGELLDASYRLTAPARLVRELEGRAAGESARILTLSSLEVNRSKQLGGVRRPR